jgi:molybdate transport system ATP-binding protein
MIRVCIQKKLQMADGVRILDVDIEIPIHSFTALYGPSGAGKTTLLRIIAGLLRPEKGIIEVDGLTWLNTEKGIDLPPQKRNIGFVFQDYGLFPNMTVAENLRYALPSKENSGHIFEMLKIVGLADLANQKPLSLSGGQQQRIALVRSILRRPGILLLDEPLSALDHATRINLQQQIQSFHSQLNLTTVLVTHHIPDICRLADSVIKIDNAKVMQTGRVDEVFNLSALNKNVLLIGEVITVDVDEVRILTDTGFISFETKETFDGVKPGDKVVVKATGGLTLQKLS